MAKQCLGIEDLTDLVLSRIRQSRQGRHVREISISQVPGDPLDSPRHRSANSSPGRCW